MQISCCFAVYGQKCPMYWYGYTSSAKCYRFMYGHMLSWQDARDMCRLHGGDLLKVESVQERVSDISINVISFLLSHRTLELPITLSVSKSIWENKFSAAKTI